MVSPLLFTHLSPSLLVGTKLKNTHSSMVASWMALQRSMVHSREILGSAMLYKMSFHCSCSKSFGARNLWYNGALGNHFGREPCHDGLMGCTVEYWKISSIIPTQVQNKPWRKCHYKRAHNPSSIKSATTKHSWLVVQITILKNMNVNGKDYPIYFGKNMFETTSQTVLDSFSMSQEPSIQGAAPVC